MLPPGSFLNNPVTSSAALTRQVQTDPILRLRLKHALHMSDDAALYRFVSTLHLQPLAEAKVMRIFYTRSSGSWGFKVRRAPIGTLVFAGPNGDPRLMQICGNPVETMSPATLIHPERIARFSPNESDTGLVLEEDTIGQIPFSGNVLAIPQIGIDTPADEIVTAVGGEEQPLIAAGAFLPPTLSIPALSSGGGGLLNLAPLSALGLLGLFPHSSSTLLPAPESTPEPNFQIFAAATCGLLALGLRFGRRRQA